MASSINLFDSIDINLDTKKKRFKAVAEIKQKYSQNSQNKQQLEVDDLLLFGYSCKLFRDDEVALKLENEANLIPWNGDSSLLIDRYDCRGYLFDLRPFDADLINKNKKSENLNQEDIEIEKLCDEERYLDLNKQLELDALYQEEELKRFYNEQHEYGAVDLKYTEIISKENDKSNKKINIEVQPKLEAFTPSEKLNLPVGMLIPETKKHNTIIERTASFVASKGLQMEILIKAKQSTNSQFDFLNYDHFLNPYYKHMVDLIKANKYTPEVDEKSDSSDDDSNSDDDYLHPLLTKNIKNNVKQDPNTNDSLKFKPNIKNSPYNDLIEKFITYSSKGQKVQEEPIQTLSNITIPNEEVKSVIDKLAEYVVKNGDAFERIIKSKNEERFSFLNSESPYFNYYQLKLNQFKEIKNQFKKDEKTVTQSKIKAKNSIISEYSNDDDESDLEDNSSNNSDPISPESKERFTKEQQAKRKLQAAMFLNLLNTTSNEDKSLKHVKRNSKSLSNSISKSRSRSRSRKHHRSKSRSSSRSRSKRKRNRRYKSSKRYHTSSRSTSRSRSRSRSRKSKYKSKRKSRSSSRHRHRHSKKGRSRSRHSRSRSSRRYKHEDDRKSHKKNRKRKSKNRKLSKSKTDPTNNLNNNSTAKQIEDNSSTNNSI